VAQARRKILYIHQSADLYGSDKTLLFLIQKLDKKQFEPIVILPLDGPLVAELEKAGAKVHFVPVLKLSRKMFKPKRLLMFPFEAVASVRKVKRMFNGSKPDIVHSNTIAVLLGMFYTKWYKVPHLWHVHEIVESPKIVTKLFKFFLGFADYIVTNSKETYNFWLKQYPKRQSKAQVVWNGLDRPSFTTAQDIQALKMELGVENDKTIIGLIGRLNRWKGHSLLLEALASLKSKGTNQFKILFVGSPPANQTHYLPLIKDKAKSLDLEKEMILLPFQKDIWKYWDVMDVVTVPSTEPEPFGLVAVEAMLAQKPVVAANHGGLKEIVIDNETGFFFEPSNSTDLGTKLSTLLNNPQQSNLLGKQGEKRAKAYFSLDKHAADFEEIYRKLIGV